MLVQMEENNRDVLKTKTVSYFHLLRDIDKLFVLSKNYLNESQENWNITEIEMIFDNIATNMNLMSEKMTFENRSMFFIMILNAMLRISAIADCNFITSQESFQLITSKLNELVPAIYCEQYIWPTHASDILFSMLTNLSKGDFIEICLKRLGSIKLAPERSNVVFHIHLLKLDSAATTVESSSDKQVDFHLIFKNYIAYAADFAGSASISSSTEFRNSYGPLMLSFKAFVTDYFMNESNNIHMPRFNVIISVLNLIWNLVDKITLIPMFIEIGFVSTVTEWIRTDIFASHVHDLANPIFSIVHNLSRDKLGLKLLREERTFETLIKLKDLAYDSDQEKLSRHFGMAMVALSLSDELAEENKKIILEAGETLYNFCKEADQDEELIYDGYHLSEILELLHRAFSNTYVIKNILANKVDESVAPIHYFMKLFLSLYGVLLDPDPDDLEKRAVDSLLKILLQISSYPEYMKELTDNNQFSLIIEIIANRLKQDTAKRILCNIRQATSTFESTIEKSSIIYISYDWADIDFCKEFVKELHNKTTIPIWVDYENVELSDDVWEYSFPIIESATHAIIFVSNAYGNSTNKFQELSCIISSRKTREENTNVLVVVAEPNYNFNRSWMKNLLLGKTVIPYNHNIDDMASKACKEIEASRRSRSGCFPFRMRNLTERTSHSDQITKKSSTAIDELVNVEILNLNSAKHQVRNGCHDGDDESSVLIPMEIHQSSLPITDQTIKT